MFEFLAAVAAFAALILALKARKRIVLLEQRTEVLEQRLEAGIAPAQSRPAPAPEPEAPAPVPFTAEPDATPAALEAAVSDLLRAERAGTADAAIREATTVPPMPPPPPAEPAAPGPSFEERFGASWVVWIGGIALALGGIFLVQYSIEAGLIGPGVRVFLGALLAAALIGAGEWTRRREIETGIAGLPSAHIPSILTAAGTTVAYAVVYASYALYGFLAPASAFILLGIVAMATLAASLLHGPALAALGQIGAFVAPMLVSTGQPNYWALYLYLAVVTAASFALARARLWKWLVITAVAFGVLWALPGIADLRFAPTPVVLYAVVGFALAAALLVSGFLYGPGSTEGRIEPISSGSIAAYLLVAAFAVLARDHESVALAGFTLLTVATVAIAWRTEAAAAAVPVAGVLAALVVADMAVEFQWTTLVAPGGPAVAPDASRVLYGPLLALGGAFAILFAGSGFLAQGRSQRAEAPILWAATGVVVPLLILIALYYRIYGFERSIPFAALALLAAALFAVATEILSKREPRPGQPSAAAIFATGSIAALALALTFALEKGWLTVALALMVPGIAWLAEQRPLPWLRKLAAIVAALVVARIGSAPHITGDLGTTPIFNWILYGYGVPALAFWLAGWLMRRRADDGASRTVEAGAILLTVLCGALEIRHYVHSGNIYYGWSNLTEAALQANGALAMAIGLERLRLRTNSIVHDLAAQLIAAIALFLIVFQLLLFENAWLNHTIVGGLFINLILLGYGLPAMLAAALGLITRQTRPQWYRTVAAVTAVVLALTYLSMQVSRFYHGPRLSMFPISQAEGYTYSAVWLAFGVLLLLIGIALRSQPVRMCSAAVVLATVAKVFLIDMAGLTGVWRALSFIGLGLVLVGIGYLYQRLLFARPRPPAAPEAKEAPPA